MDGVEMKNEDKNDVRSRIEMVKKDVEIFEKKIRENIGLGKKGERDEEIIDEEKDEIENELIMEIENGYEKEVGERGIKI